MQGNFIYHNPTKIYFGKNSIENLKAELLNYGSNVILVYGGGSIKQNGIYQNVCKILRSCKKKVLRISNVKPNPTLLKLLQGKKKAKNFKPDLILAIGGGSVIDYAKALSSSIYCREDIWKRYFVKQLEPKCKTIPVGCILTMVGTGSEMNGGSVITNTKLKLKIGKHFKDTNMFPKFAILDPTYTFSVPKYQMVSGIFDIFSHACEQYFSGNDDNLSDYLAEGIMKCVVNASYKALANPCDYEARSNIMWASSWALNTLLRKGKSQDWMPHKIGQAIAGVTNATHGMTLSAISLPYYYLLMPYALDKFVRFAINVWNINPINKSKKLIAKQGLKAMGKWMKKLGLVLSIKDLGVKYRMIKPIANSVLIQTTGYKVLTLKEIIKILKESYGDDQWL